VRTWHEGPVVVVDFGDGENRVDETFLGELAEAVAAAEGPGALVTTGSGRFYSNGLDLDAVRDGRPEHTAELLRRFERLLADVLAAPVITVAAINGHCYAAGALLALAHDFRIMRGDRGFFCLPSVDIGIPFTSGMTRLLTMKIPAPHDQALVVSGDRIGGETAHELGVVHETAPEGEVLPRAIELATRLAGKDPDTLGTIKRRMYAPVLERLSAV